MEKTNDRDYEVEERYVWPRAMGSAPISFGGGGVLLCSGWGILIWCRRYRTMESAANRLQKEAKGYLDSLRGDTLQVSRVQGYMC